MGSGLCGCQPLTLACAHQLQPGAGNHTINPVVCLWVSSVGERDWAPVANYETYLAL